MPDEGEPRKASLEDTIPAPDLRGVPEQPPPEERYRFGAELGRGGMGRVVEAFDTHLGRTVALKEVLPKGGSSISRRFRREIQITARLEHPSIVPLYDAGTMPDGRPYYVMRRVTGQPLDELLLRARGLNERLALLPHVLDAIDAIAHAHKRGVIHRDLKPANILVGEHGETVVIDWGLAKVIGEEDDDTEPRVPQPPADSLQTQIGAVFGTPGFMAPEQARGDDLSTRSDVFALGATLYQLLSGKPPVSGDSATRMIEATVDNKIVPLAQTAPGAPPPLVALVDKALAYEPQARYRDAGALGEDVRRFLTGQLVAAHHYTVPQRVARFARRHRAPLSVAALASVAVAVLAWVAVHRILEARDTANEAKAVAELRRQEAEQSRDKLAAQYDAFVVERARELLDKNPTEAIAVLKQLAPGTKKLGDARAIAKAAVMRGVPWALKLSAGQPNQVDIDLDTSRVLISTFDGEVTIWDLDARKRLAVQMWGRGAHLKWIAGHKVFVARPNIAPAIFDPATGQLAPLPLGPLDMVEASANGEHVAFIDHTHQAGVLDVATLATRALPTPSPANWISIAPRGEAIAVVDTERAIVFGADGKELAHHDGKIAFAAFSRSGELALLDNVSPSRVYWCTLAQLAWQELAIPKDAALVINLFFRGDELEVIAPNQVVGYLHGNKVRRRVMSRMIAPWADDIGEGVLAMPSGNGSIALFSSFAEGELPLPGVVSGMRIAGRHGKSRFVVAGAGALLVYELDAFWPHSEPAHSLSAAYFVDDDMVVLHGSLDEGWSFRDLRTGDVTTTDVSWSAGPTRVDCLERRVLLTSFELSRNGQPPVNLISLITPGSRKVTRLLQASNAFASLVEGDAIIVAGGDDIVRASVGGGPLKDVVRLDSRVVAIRRLGHLRFAAVSARGELVRGTIGGPIEHARVDSADLLVLGAELDGRLLVAAGTHLFAWDTAVTEIAKLEEPVMAIDVADGGAVLSLQGRQTDWLPRGPAAQPRPLLPPMSSPALVARDGRTLIAEGANGQVNVVDLPSLTRWTIPVRYSANSGVLDLSPARRIVQGQFDGAAVWTLPQPGADFGAWLEEVTNATESSDVLTWPWQAPGP